MPTPFELLNSSGDRISGNIHLPQSPAHSPSPVVVICHGFKGFKEWGFFPHIAETFAQHGFSAIRFNFSHNGVEDDSDFFTRLDLFAHSTFGKELEDLGAVLDSIEKGALPHSAQLNPEQIAILGHSRGAVATLLEGPRHSGVRALATWGGISDCQRWDEETRRHWREQGQLLVSNVRTSQQMPIDVSVLDDLEAHPEEYDILSHVQNLAIPFLVVHGDEDETVPFSEALLLHDATPRGLRKLQLIPGAGHTFGAVHPFKEPSESLEDALRATIEWFQLRLH